MEHKVLEEIADRIPAVIVAKSRDGKFIYANRECERLFQVKAEWLIGKTNYDFMPEDIAEKIIAHDQIVLTEGIAHQFDEEILINGERHIYSCLRFPLRDDAGNICGVGGISTDITESKRHEEALAASERRFRDFFAQVPVGMFIGDSEGNLLHVNPSFCRFTGYTEQELLSRETNALKRVTYQEDIGESLKKFNLLMSGKISELTLEKRYIRKDGRIVWGRVSATRRSEDGLYRYIGIVEDIDDRKQAEEALKASEERYRITSETAQDAIITIDEESRIVQANPATENIFGYPHGELHGKPLTMLMPEWLRQAHHDGMKRHIATGRRQLHWGAVQIPGLHRDGREIPLEISFGRFIKNGKFFFTGIARDISERKKAEEEIRESRERLRNLIETTSDLVWEVDERGVYTYASPQVSKILGYAPEEVLGKTPFDLMPPEEAERVAGIFRNIAASQQPFSFLENVNIHRNGARIVLETSGVPFFDASGVFRGYRGIDRDITGRKKAEEELQKAQRIESIGILAGGIAHDFNNILTGILGNITLARMFLPPGDMAAQRLNSAERSSLRAQSLTHQLLTFAKGGAPVKKVIAVPTLVRDAVEFALRGSKVRAESFFPPDLRPVEADESQLNQVINNLALNAVQAMPEGGVLSVAAANVTLRSKNNVCLAAGEYVRIDIKDQGVGISEEDRGKIFDPYFTTKERGSGLGLSISFSIIKRHGGTITVDSMPGEGSTFSIFLPASKEKPVSLPKEEHQEAVSGVGRILVMDDEETVRDVIAEMLQYLGYRVETEKDGAAAITAYRQALAAGEPFAAVIVDLTIPAGMGGKEAVRHLLEIDPQAKVIVSSGYANDPIMSDFADYGFKGVIPKPYKLDELGKKLGEVLSCKGEQSPSL